MAEPGYPVLKELETKLKLLWVDTDDVMATQRAIIQVEPEVAYLELPRGRKGDKGDPGPAISIQGIVMADSQLPASAEIGHAYVNTSTKGLAVWNGSQWFKVDNFAGVDADVQQFSRWFAQIESDTRRAADAASRATDSAERAEFAAEETIQQVSGDFATRNYVDGATWLRPALDASANVDTLHSGLYPVPTSTVATALELPLGEPGELSTTWLDSGGLRRRQTYYTDRSASNLGMIIYRRWYYNGTWNPWSSELQSYPTVLGTENLNDITQSGTYIQISTSAGTKELNYPVIGDGSTGVGILRVTTASGLVEQVLTEFRNGKIHFRGRNVAGAWNNWTTLPNQTGTTPGGSSTSGLPVLDMEVTGKWTPNANGDQFLNELAAKHEMVTVEEIGRSLHDWPIYAAVIGDPTLPAVLVIAGQHGTEVGPPEGAWLWCRELTKQKSLALMDVCVIVVPMVNPDNRFVARGNKAAVDLNRDWVDLSQPETQAVDALFDEYNIVAGVDVHNFGYPRETSYKESEFGDTTTQSLAVELENVVATALAEDEQPARRYGPEMADTSFPNAVSALHEIPSILIEIPCGGYGTWTFDVYNPAPSWQAHIMQLTCDAVLEHVAANITSFDRVP